MLTGSLARHEPHLETFVKSPRKVVDGPAEAAPGGILATRLPDAAAYAAGTARNRSQASARNPPSQRRRSGADMTTSRLTPARRTPVPGVRCTGQVLAAQQRQSEDRAVTEMGCRLGREAADRGVQHVKPAQERRAPAGRGNCRTNSATLRCRTPRRTSRAGTDLNSRPAASAAQPPHPPSSLSRPATAAAHRW